MTSSRVGTPLAAVIVPCFNDGPTVRETVDSIRCELLEFDFEFVVVDDGSTDLVCLGVLDELEDQGVRVIHQSNQGPSAATMTGFRATTSQYVMRLDADDLLEPGALVALAGALDRAPEAAVAWGDVQTFGLTTFRIPGSPSLDPWLLTYTNCIPGAGCLMRREAVLEAGGWQLRHGWEDWDLWMALVERGWSGEYVPRTAFRYRRDERGRHMESVGGAEAHYEELRRRHDVLFANRAANRAHSDAPRVLKFAVRAIEALPCVPRLARIQLCELVTRLFWNGGARATMTMVKQAVLWRRDAARAASDARPSL